MKDTERFSKEQLIASKTLGFTRDLKEAVLCLEKKYTRKEAEHAIQQYLDNTVLKGRG